MARGGPGGLSRVRCRVLFWLTRGRGRVQVDGIEAKGGAVKIDTTIVMSGVLAGLIVVILRRVFFPQQKAEP